MQEAAKIMRREKIEGAMVNILSMSAHGGQPFIIAYSGSKGALATLTKNAAFSLMPWRIRVNGLNIGWMNTPGEDRIMGSYHGAQDGWLEKAAKEQPWPPARPARSRPRGGLPAQLESGLMTGSVIDFDQSVIGCYESAPHPSTPAGLRSTFLGLVFHSVSAAHRRAEPESAIAAGTSRSPGETAPLRSSRVVSS